MRYAFYAAVTAVLVSGCAQMVNVDYTGQKFAPLPQSEELKFFRSRQDMPVDEYTIIGRFVVTAPERSDLYTFKKEFMEQGRNYGGDAVCLISTEIVSRGAYEANSGEFGAPAAGDKKAPQVEPSQRGAARALTGERTVRRRRVAKALLLKRRSEVKKLLDD